MGHTVIQARTKAEMGMALLKEAILDHLEDHPEGVGNAELANHLNLRSDQEGRPPEFSDLFNSGPTDQREPS
jgi:hypothetical protein